MAVRIGITTDLEVAKWELERKYKNTRGWKATNPFDNEKLALSWQETKQKELACKNVEAIKGPKVQRIRWYGFLFEHDGPR